MLDKIDYFPTTFTDYVPSMSASSAICEALRDATTGQELAAVAVLPARGDRDSIELTARPR